jgi:hypothetical protein
MARKAKPVGAGHNQPPDPVTEALKAYQNSIDEAINWLDGEPVSNDDQMKMVDRLLKDVKSAQSVINDAEASATKPLYDEWKREKSRWKPTIDRLAKIRKGLITIVDSYKRKKAAEAEAARLKAEAEARAARERAEAEVRKAAQTEGDFSAQERAEQAQREAKEASDALSAARKAEPRGLRTYTVFEVTDFRLAARWMFTNAESDMRDWIAEYARRNPDLQIDGVTSRTEKRAV